MKPWISRGGSLETRKTVSVYGSDNATIPRDAMDQLAAPEYFLFSLSLMLVAGLLVIEIALLLTIGGSAALDAAAPDVAVLPDAVNKALSVLGFGKVPAILVMIALLTFFGVAGFLIQGVAREIFMTPLPAIVAAPIAFIGAVEACRRFVWIIQRYLPSDETSAVERATLVGRTATIVYGDATPDRPATAAVADDFGSIHRVQVKSEAGVIEQGSLVLIIAYEGAFFIVGRDSAGK